MASTRIPELDLMRGIALIGIFLMNIVSMAYPVEAYTNPIAFDSSNWSLSVQDRFNLGWRMDDSVFSILYVFVNHKMFSLFAFLFGVSAMIILDPRHGGSRKYYFARNVWLFIFGCLHLSFLFYGDILWLYSLCGLLLWIFASRSPKFLLVLSASLFIAGVVLMLKYQQDINHYSQQQLIALKSLWMPKAQWNLDLVSMMKMPIDSFPLSAFTCLSCFAEESAVANQYFGVLTVFAVLQTFSIMLLGMGLYKLGFIPSLNEEGERNPVRYSMKTYQIIGCSGVALGIVLSTLGVALNYSNQWSTKYSAVQGDLLVSIAAPIMLIAYISLLLLWSKSNLHQQLKTAIQAMGRMALSNYILQSVIGIFLFTGLGLGYFGELSRLQLLLVAVLVCCILAVFSMLWMRYFNYGPLEWLWRSLSKFQLARICRPKLHNH